jgi:hypothetical protein
VEKSYCLNIKTLHELARKGENPMDLSAYFLTLEYVLIASTFVALLLIFLYSYYGKEEEQASEKS